MALLKKEKYLPIDVGLPMEGDPNPNDFEYVSSKFRTVEKVRKIPSSYAKRAFIGKVILEDDRERIPGENLPLPDDGTNLNNDTVTYSMNKQSRWRLADWMKRNIEDMQDEDAGYRVSVIELEHDDPTCWRSGYAARNSCSSQCTSYTTVENGKYVSREPKKTYAQAHTLWEKAKTPKKIRNRRRNAQADQNLGEENGTETNSGGVSVRYQVIRYCQSYSKIKSQEKKLKTYRNNYHTMQSTRKNAKSYMNMLLEEEPHEDSYSDGSDCEHFNQQIETRQEGPTPTFSLSDFVTMPEKTQKRKRVSPKLSSNSSSSSSLSDYELVDKVFLQQASVDETTIPHKFYNKLHELFATEDNDENVPSTSTGGPTLSISPLPFTFVPVSVEIPDSVMSAEVLTEEFGEKYYEVSSIPRRFCIDISESVKNVLEVSHGNGSETINPHILVIFQVSLPILSDFKVLDNSVTPWSNVKVWINGNFSKDIGQVSCSSIIEENETYYPEQILKASALHIGTLPLECFEHETLAEVSMSNLAKTPEKGLIGKYIMPKAETMLENEATEVVLEESNSSKKLQRQLTAVECYPWFSNEEDTVCNICYNYPIRDIGMCLPDCHHWFCDECWSYYLLLAINNGSVPILCPASNCDSMVDYDTLSTILPLPLVRKYGDRYRDKYLQKNSNQWIWCPNEKCGRVLHTEKRLKKVDNVMSCVCGKVWCRLCHQDAHWPASCEHAEIYMKKLKHNGHDKHFVMGHQEVMVKVKRCPHCELPMEKGFGCNHISCRCGKDFCWACNCNWDSGRHYNCKSSSSHEKVLLTDVQKGSDNIMSNDFYLRAVGHRHANFPARLKSCKLLIREMLNHKKLLLIPGAEEKLKGKSSEEQYRIQISLSQEFLQRFSQLYIQAHSVLEYAYVWIYFNRMHNTTNGKALMNTADRLNYVLHRLEDQCKQKKMKYCVDNLPVAEKFLKNFVLHIISIQKE